jgi:hypothetical protein
MMKNTPPTAELQKASRWKGRFHPVEAFEVPMSSGWKESSKKKSSKRAKGRKNKGDATRKTEAAQLLRGDVEPVKDTFTSQRGPMKCIATMHEGKEAIQTV